MWIKHTPPHAATGPLKSLYDRIAAPDGSVDNVMLSHSLRPHTLEGHMALYKAVLHHSGNTVAPWFLECVGLWVSILNRCTYCVEHHFAGMSRLIGDDKRAKAIRKALEASEPDKTGLDARYVAALDYADALTSGPAFIDADDVIELRDRGWDDGQILELNQVAAYFNYVNRTVLGLGTALDDEKLGLAPRGNEAGDWSHS